MRHANGKLYSITIRPYGGVNARWPDILAQLQTRYAKEKYLFSVEKDGTAASHVQGYLCLSQDVRQDNVRRYLKSQFPPNEHDNVRAYIVVKTHDNPKYLVGYCLKESQSYVTSLTESELEEGKKFYNDFCKPVSEKRLKGMPAMSKVIQWMSQKVLELGCSPSELSVMNCMRRMIWDKLLTPEESAKIKIEVLSLHWEVLCCKEAPAVSIDEVEIVGE